MSKMDDLRAMREARYAEAQRRASAAPARRRVAAPVAPPAAAASKAGPAAPPEVATGRAATGELCGHRNMSGRTCTRPQGHPQKSHRYS